MKKLIVIITVFLLMSAHETADAVYNPQDVPNNKFGIHILFPEEVSQAADLVNSSGGEWGYVTVPIRASDKDLTKWQAFMDECRKHRLIPIVRIATEGDYFVEGSWEIPSTYYVIDFANFLNSLHWPTENRYVIIFNEQNRGDEWGGTPDPAAYAEILDSAVEVFKARSDKFFVVFGGLDNAAPNIVGQYIDQLTYIRRVNEAKPGVFEKIDGISVHAYPNPGFASPPSYNGTNSIYAYQHVGNLIREFSGKELPVFITETGWGSSIPLSTQASYYKTAFENAWNEPNIIAVTPFLLLANSAPFDQFSFVKNGNKTEVYNTYKSLSKVKGKPKLEPKRKPKTQNFDVSRIADFSETIKKSFREFDDQTKLIFKWILNI